MTLPGSEFASGHGFSLHSYSGDKKSATYNSGGVFLTVWSVPGELLAQLSFSHKMLTIQTGVFSLPNKNFKVFSDTILSAYFRLEEI